MALILFQQTLTMLLLMGLGLFLTKRGMLTEEFTSRLSNLLLMVIIPCVTVRSFIVPMADDGLMPLFWAFVYGAGTLGISMLVSYLVFGGRQPVDNFGACFSNAGFIGIPLIQATFGDAAVFYITPLICLLNVFVWTYGVRLLAADDAARPTARQLLVNPMVLSGGVGVVLYILQLPVPSVLYNAIDAVGSMNTPVAMLVLGSYRAKASVRKMVRDRATLVASVIRLLAIPLVTLAAMWVLRLSITDPLPASIFIAACAPIGANTAIFAQQFGGDYVHAVQLVCFSTVLSVVTIPLVFQLATLVLA